MAAQRYFWRGSPRCLAVLQGWGERWHRGREGAAVVGRVGGRGQSTCGVFLYIPEGLDVKVMFWGAAQWWLKEHGGKEMQSQC